MSGGMGEGRTAYLPSLVLTLLAAVLIRLGNVLRAADDNLADLGD